MSLVSGTGYLFPSVAPMVKEIMQYEQYQIATIATMGNIGTYVCFLPNPVVGPRLSCVIASLMLFGGYFLAYCSIMKWFQTNYILMGIFFILVGNGSASSYLTAMQTNIRNFSQIGRGRVVGTMASMFGLSSAVFGIVFKYGFKNNFNQFFLFLAITTGSVPLVSTLFMNYAQGRVQIKASNASEEKEEEKDLMVEKVADTQMQVNSSHSLESRKNEIFKDVFTAYLLVSIDFWLLFVVFFAGAGSGLTIINNLGSIALSYGGQMGSQNALVILFALSNCTGRILAGFLSDLIVNYATRVTILNFSLLGMGLVSYAFAFASFNFLYPLVICSGLLYGSIWAMAPAYLSDRFGHKYFALHFSLLCMAPMAGSSLLATLLASAVYQAHARKDSRNCYGKACWQLTFFVNCIICVIAFAVSGMLLMYRSKRMYTLINAYHREQRQKTSQISNKL
jgi:MFS family permease